MADYKSAKEKIEKQFKELKQRSTAPAEPISKYLTKKLEGNQELEVQIMQSHKTFKKCLDYVIGKARKYLNGSNGYIEDETVYKWSTEYFALDDEEIEMSVIEAGAEDLSVEDEYYEIITDVADFATVRDALADEGYVFSMAELRYLPQNMMSLSNEDDIKNMNKLVDLLEEDDDVQNVYHNWG